MVLLGRERLYITNVEKYGGNLTGRSRGRPSQSLSGGRVRLAQQGTGLTFRPLLRGMGCTVHWVSKQTCGYIRRVFSRL